MSSSMPACEAGRQVHANWMQIVEWAQGARSNDMCTRKSTTLCHLLQLLNWIKEGDEAFKPVLKFRATVPPGLTASDASSRALPKGSSLTHQHMPVVSQQAYVARPFRTGAAARMVAPHRPGLGVAAMRVLFLPARRPVDNRRTAHLSHQDVPLMPGTALNLFERGRRRDKRKANTEICPISPPKKDFTRQWTLKSFNNDWEVGSVRMTVPIVVSSYFSGVRLLVARCTKLIYRIECVDMLFVVGCLVVRSIKFIR